MTACFGDGLQAGLTQAGYAVGLAARRRGGGGCTVHRKLCRRVLDLGCPGATA